MTWPWMSSIRRCTKDMQPVAVPVVVAVPKNAQTMRAARRDLCEGEADLGTGRLRSDGACPVPLGHPDWGLLLPSMIDCPFCTPRHHCTQHAPIVECSDATPRLPPTTYHQIYSLQAPPSACKPRHTLDSVCHCFRLLLFLPPRQHLHTRPRFPSLPTLSPHSTSSCLPASTIYFSNRSRRLSNTITSHLATPHDDASDAQQLF